tara:strand:+ start:150 stop:350 length:201 start_codon:yes stop_codon:yes gene_type:complete
MIKLKSKDQIISMLIDLLSDSDNLHDMSVEGWINALKWVLSIDDTVDDTEETYINLNGADNAKTNS